MPRACARGQCLGSVGAQPEGFPYGRQKNSVVLVVHVIGCPGWAVLVCCRVSDGVLSVLRMALWARLGPWLAGTWVGMALAVGRLRHVVVGRRGGVGGERGWERGALHDPIVYNDSCVLRSVERVTNCDGP